MPPAETIRRLRLHEQTTRPVGEAGSIGRLERLLGRPVGAAQGWPQSKETQAMIDESHMMSPGPGIRKRSK